jgi:hypothetical protein
VLRAAAEADDHEFAQTILASAGVRLPDGMLLTCVEASCLVPYSRSALLSREPTRCI